MSWTAYNNEDKKLTTSVSPTKSITAVLNSSSRSLALIPSQNPKSFTNHTLLLLPAFLLVFAHCFIRWRHVSSNSTRQSSPHYIVQHSPARGQAWPSELLTYKQ